MKLRDFGLQLGFGALLAACGEPPARDVDSVSVVMSVQTSEPAAPPPPPEPFTTAPMPSASTPASPDPDELEKQRLLRALEDARNEAKKPKAPRPRSSSAACPASDPLCD